MKIILKREKTLAKSRFLRFFIFLVLLFTFSTIIYTKKISAFGHKEVAFINIGIPTIRAAINARKNHAPILKSVIQAICGGYIMQEGFKLAAGSEKKSAWHAWEAKLMLNMGASIAESAAKDFVFRMDVGPIWIISSGTKILLKPGLASTLSAITNFTDGSKLDWGRTFKYGTLAFRKPVRNSGTISSSGALAYSNANIFTTNKNGAHAGHELVHTFQYRRESFWSPNISKLFPEIGKKIGNGWVDDTGWSINWGAQCAWADMIGKSKDFDIPMEKEAYYLEEKYKQKY